MKFYLDLLCNTSIQIYNVYINDGMDDNDKGNGYKNPRMGIIKCSFHLNIHLAFGFHILVS